MSVTAALVLCRIVNDGAALFLWGAFGYLAALVPPDLAYSLGARLRPFRLILVTLTVLSAVARLPIEAAMIGDRGWSDAVDPAILSAVLTTSVGAAWCWQILATGAIVLVTSLAPQRLQSSGVAAGAGVMLAGLALSGHAAMHEGALGLLHRSNDVVHVLAGGAWLGALVPLLMVLARLDDPACSRAAALAVRRFSRVGHGVVALVIISGIGNTMLVLGRWPTDRASPYQALLGVKIALVATMTALALVNRYAVVPTLSRRRRPALCVLVHATWAEIALGIAVLSCVGVYGALDPT